MKRRDFLGTMLAGVAATSLPLAALEAPAPALQIWNTATLTASLEKMFVCQLGPAMAFFEVNKDGDIVEAKSVTVPDANYPNLSNEVYPNVIGRKRYIYTTYACAIEGGTAEEAEARLAKYFYDEFSKLPAGALIWRVRPQFESFEATKWGDTFLTSTQAEDYLGRQFVAVEVVREPKWSQIGKTRFVYDPNAKLEIPSGVELDPDTGDYKYVLGKVPVHKMRMRLVMPHLYASPEEDKYPLPHLLKAEGAMINRMV